MTTPQGRTRPVDRVVLLPGDTFLLHLQADGDGIVHVSDPRFDFEIHTWEPTLKLGTIGWWESQHRPRRQSRLERLVRRLAGWGPDR